MTITTQTQYQTTASSISASQTEKNAPSVDTAESASSSADPFAITDVYESSSETAASTEKYKTYSNILTTMKSAQTASAAPASATATAASQVASSSNNNSSVSSLLESSSDEEEETTELVYNADGSVYEKTTTTDADGNETVTMTKVSDAKATEE